MHSPITELAQASATSESARPLEHVWTWLSQINERPDCSRVIELVSWLPCNEVPSQYGQQLELDLPSPHSQQLELDPDSTVCRSAESEVGTRQLSACQSALESPIHHELWDEAEVSHYSDSGSDEMYTPYVRELLRLLGPAILSIIEPITDPLEFLERFLWFAIGNQGPGDNEHNETSSGHSKTGVSNLGGSKSGVSRPLAQKRSIAERGLDNDDVSDDDGSKRPSKRGRGKRNMLLERQLFACPFWKYDPVQHRTCLPVILGGASRVKQHLTRNHAPIYCHRCLATFSDDESHDAHVDSVNCQRDPAAGLDGLSDAQREQLSRRMRGPEAERWYGIWDICFPGRTRPSSPYLDHRLTEDCAVFQEHFLSHGSRVILEEIQRDGVPPFSWGSDQTRIIQQRIELGLRRIVDSWTPPQELTSHEQTIVSQGIVTPGPVLSEAADYGYFFSNSGAEPCGILDTQPLFPRQSSSPAFRDVDFSVPEDDYLKWPPLAMGDGTNEGNQDPSLDVGDLNAWLVD
jgi:hypothetical protein